ncbi:nucleotidyltransferase family protein [Roseofilum capinflatum]|uniref:Nucleotidyltransferase domain-containing protein n=1 Tax=Roseofilum capinflatum BLCC-M114 TaxID=3022440 RepID=A0ABT7B3V6_9CYAN|nr:nucleotidyltransferase domain-containing protein [Roseofilum capinflatum]MDJ1173864.1 nucleotidyltransferase domain-containing protein [Roseofilum capinflatum BLCC-M114]
MRWQSNLEISLEAIADFCQRWQIVELSVFGSILRDDFNSNSDIDFLFTLSPDAHWGLFKLLEMQQELEKLVCRPVDFVSKRAIERSENWLRREEILGNAEIIYEVRSSNIT